MAFDYFDDVYYDTLEATIQSIVKGYFEGDAQVENNNLAEVMAKVTNDVITAFSVSLLNT